MKLLASILLVGLLGCGAKQTQDTTQTVHAQQAVLESSQDAVQSQGANVKGAVESVVTENTTGVPALWFIIGGLLFGIMIPRPSIIRRIFND